MQTERAGWRAREADLASQLARAHDEIAEWRAKHEQGLGDVKLFQLPY